MYANTINNEETLKKVNNFIDGFTYKLDRNSAEVVDFIEETKSNIFSSIQDLMSKGHTEEDAFNIVVNEFGDMETLQYELNSLYKVNKTIRKSLLVVAIVTLIIGSILITCGYVYERNIQSIYYKILLTPLQEKVGTKDNPISDGMKNTLKSIVENNSFIEAGGIFTSKVTKRTDGSIMYGTTEPYIKDKNFKFDYLFPSNGLTVKNQYFANDKKGLIFSYQTDELYFPAFSLNNPDTDIIINVAYRIKGISMLYYFICTALLLGYWIIFSIWAGMNILYERRNKLWIVLVVFLNIIGYGLYKYYQFRLERKIH